MVHNGNMVANNGNPMVHNGNTVVNNGNDWGFPENVSSQARCSCYFCERENPNLTWMTEGAPMTEEIPRSW